MTQKETIRTLDIQICSLNDQLTASEEHVEVLQDRIENANLSMGEMRHHREQRLDHIAKLEALLAIYIRTPE